MELPTWWTEKPKVFRVWAIATVSWMAGVFLFFMVIDPNSIGTDLMYELKNFNPGWSFVILFLLMVFLPGAVGGGIWAYYRFLKKPAAEADEEEEDEK